MRYHSVKCRVLVAVCIGSFSVCYAVYAHSLHTSPPSPRPESKQTEADPQNESVQWSPVTGVDSSAVASQLAITARGDWIAKGMDEAKAAQLADDVAIILQAIFAPDFEKYHGFMISRGLKLDVMASALTDQLIEWKLYSGSTPELAADQPIETRFAYMWHHAKERRAEWSSVRLSSLSMGFGLEFTSDSNEWPYPGEYSQMSVYIPPHGRLTVSDGEAINTSKDSAWISIEGRFKNGMQTRARINFYYNKSLANWIPLDIVFGTDGDYRPFPLI